jgi:hypothetical protein
MKIVSSEPLRVTTLGGTAVLFEAGVPREIAEEIGLLAIQMGAKEYNDKYVEEEAAEVVEFEEENVVAEPAQPDQELIEVLQKLIEEADPNSFKTDGTPKAAVVNKMLGRTVRTDEREAAWEIALNA